LLADVLFFLKKEPKTLALRGLYSWIGIHF
jgi:hypothetical protein